MSEIVALRLAVIVEARVPDAHTLPMPPVEPRIFRRLRRMRHWKIMRTRLTNPMGARRRRAVRVIVSRAEGEHFSSGGEIPGFLDASPEHVSRLAWNIQECIHAGIARARCRNRTLNTLYET